MKAEELRIGNYVFAKGTEAIRFTSFFGLCNIESYPERYTPIPLTEEWLLKLGFKEGNKWYKDAYSLEVLNTDFYLRPSYRGGYYWGFNISDEKGDCELNDVQPILYVHSLQNLIYALTGSELTIKQ